LGGQCLIHLYGTGQSRRGPSFRLQYDSITGAKLEHIFTILGAEKPKKTSRLAKREPHLPSRALNVSDLYIPAPADCSKDEVLDWHITTRNVFAFGCKKPLVGGSLGQSLIALHERLTLWRPKTRLNHEDIFLYMKDMGYLELAHCPDYALALLQYAEHYRLEDMWMDAYAHCVGMKEMLMISSEFEVCFLGLWINRVC
jgi:hypothetical protein